MGEVLYEAHYEFGMDHLILPMMLIGCTIMLFFRNRSKGERIFIGSALLFTLVISIIVGIDQFNLYRTVVGAYESGDYEIVEGYVENFDPMPRQGHKNESFDIDGIHFSYSDNRVMTGYHNTKVKGGVITGNGQYLKIGYISRGTDDLGNVIVYIESLSPPEPQ